MSTLTETETVNLSSAVEDEAVNGNRCGPISSSAFAALIRLNPSTQQSFIAALAFEINKLKNASNISRQHVSLMEEFLDKARDLVAKGGPCAFVFVGTRCSGYLVRSDVVSLRMRNSRLLSFAQDLREPGARVESMDLHKDKLGSGDWSKIFGSAIGVLAIQEQSQESLSNSLPLLDSQLSNRLSIPLTQPTKPIPRRVCVLGGGFSPQYRDSFLAAATSLQLSLVVLDRPTHWLATRPDMCDAFLAVDMSVDPGLDGRIIKALDEYGHSIHGIFSMSDRWLEPAGRVAKRLGLPHQPIKAIQNCTEKTRFRQMFPIADHSSLTVNTVEEFNDQAHVLEGSYPYIIKPSAGACSVGVHKADDRDMAEQQVRKLIESNNKDILIEKYIGGPEVDIDAVLIDSELVFFDIADEPPCTAEMPSASPSSTVSFLESQMLWPSILPQAEQELLRIHAHVALVKLGFTDGVFNIEARVINSASIRPDQTESVTTQSTLGSSRGSKTRDNIASTMLIEVNARVLGYPGVNAVEHAYGIDHAAIQMLLSIGDRNRAALVSKPFASVRGTSVIAYWVCATRGGRFLGSNMFEDLKNRRPDLSSYLVEQVVYFKDGDMLPVPQDGQAKWIALLTVRSEQGRAHAYGICQEIEGELKYSLSDG